MKQLKKINYLWLFLTTLHLFSCTTNELDVKVVQPESREIINTSQNEVFDGVAQTISKLMRESTDFRRIVRKMALDKFDGDFDIMLKTLGEQPIADLSAVRGGGSTVTVSDLFNELYPATKSISREEILETLVEMYPLMQISVPFHADIWEDGYIPTVIFLDEEYQENVTKFVKGYNADGSEVWVDAINPPDVPVIVVGFNERNGLSLEEQEQMAYTYIQQVMSQAPRKVTPRDSEIIGSANKPFLSINVTSSNIYLSWTQPTMSSTVLGYRIYRKAAGETNFTLITTNGGASNTTYYDTNYVSLQNYDYYVASYCMVGLAVFTANSNIVSCTAPVRPAPVESFTLTPLNTTRLMLSWVSPNTYVDSLEIHRLNLLGEDEPSHIATIANPQSSPDTYVDNVEPGQKYMYQLINYLGGNYSTSVRDIYYAPYRNVHQTEDVYVNKMGYSCDVSEIEGIFQGAPEFYLTILNPDEDGNVTRVGTDERIIFTFNERSTKSQTFSDRLILNWLAGDEGWMDKITIHAAEYDRDAEGDSFKIDVSMNIKITEAVTIELGDIQIEYDYNPRKMDCSCGEIAINYFDNPERTYTFPNYGFYIKTNNE